MTPVVELRGVTRRFGATVAVADVTLDVQPGEVFGLLGHNGAGKTTLIRLVTGLLEPQSGQIRTFGLDPVSQGREVRGRSGVLTTYPGLDGYLSPAENLAVYAAIHGLEPVAAARRSTALLARLGLDPRSTEPARSLSAGLKQRVALARALVHDPELLLLDEPTANLDPIAARDVRDLVRGLATEGRTVVFSTHNLAEAESLCDRVAILRDGHLLAVGSLSDLAKGRLHGGVELRVGAGQGDAALTALRPVLNGHSSTRVEDRLEVGQASQSEVAAWVRALVHANVDVVGVHPRSPSLEDVYLALHQPAPAPPPPAASHPPGAAP